MALIFQLPSSDAETHAIQGTRRFSMAFVPRLAAAGFEAIVDLSHYRFVTDAPDARYGDMPVLVRTD